MPQLPEPRNLRPPAGHSTCPMLDHIAQSHPGPGLSAPLWGPCLPCLWVTVGWALGVCQVLGMGGRIRGGSCHQQRGLGGAWSHLDDKTPCASAGAIPTLQFGLLPAGGTMTTSFDRPWLPLDLEVLGEAAGRDIVRRKIGVTCSCALCRPEGKQARLSRWERAGGRWWSPPDTIW